MQEQEKPQVEQEPELEAAEEFETASSGFRFGVLAVALLAFVGLFGYSIHERNLARQLAGQNDQTTAALKETRSQMDALNAKLDSLAAERQPVTVSQPVVSAAQTRPSVLRHSKPDPRWKKFQSQLDTQGKAIEETRNNIESTRQDLSSARTELQGSIARTHDEIVVLQRKGERNYYEFDLDKAKRFMAEGPIGVRLRKANVKHQYADLELLVDDVSLTKKHVNLYEPAVFYAAESEHPVELVINKVTKNHIHGYVSAPKYRRSELAAMGQTPAATDGNMPGSASSPPKTREHLAMPK